jgi:exodeoxyribonuclease VII large subunit
VSAARTPVVSAIGHEPDSPLLDLVADRRAATPTDAAKTVVPDVAEEVERITHARGRIRSSLAAWLDRERHQLEALRARPSLADPGSGLDDRSLEVSLLRDRARRSLHHQLDRAHGDLTHQLARVRGLSPLATLRRGYAVVQDADGHVVTSPDQTAVGAALRVRVAAGRLDVLVQETHTQEHSDDE